ncbi:MAG: MFS transporter [Burkholderiales bacterium]|nr:MFS transporter [Burkholderiales bacterium]
MWLKLDQLGVQALWTAIIVQFVAGLMTSSVSAVAPQIISSIHFNTSFIGLYTSCVYVGACICSLIGGTFIRKYGPARMAEYGLIGFALSLFLCLFGWPAIIIGSGLILGLGKGLLMPANNTMISHHTNRSHLNLVFSIKQTSGPVGVALSGILLPFLAVIYDWRLALAFVASTGVFGAYWCWKVKKDQDTYTVKMGKINLSTLGQSLKLVIEDRSLLQLALLSVCYKGLSAASFAYLVTFLVHEQFSLQFAGLALSISTAGTFVGRLFWGWLADKVESSKLVLALCGLVMGVSAICLAQITSETVQILVPLVTFFFGFSAKGWSGVYFAQVAISSPQGRVAEATGGAHFFMYIGAIFVPMIFGLLVTYLQNDYRLTFYIIAAITIFSASIVFSLKGAKAEK